MDMRSVAAALPLIAGTHAVDTGDASAITESASGGIDDEQQANASACKCSITSLVAAEGGELLAACTDDTVAAVHIWRVRIERTTQTDRGKGSIAARSAELQHLRVIRAHPRRPRPGEPQEHPPFPHFGAMHLCGDTLFVVLSDMRLRSI